ncbi:hypothetical protein ABNB72_17335 [Paenibacillus larvae]
MIIDGIEYEDVLEITGRRVLRSAAGFYIGRLAKWLLPKGGECTSSFREGFVRRVHGSDKEP